MNKKIMTEEEMNNFIESVGRAEFFEEKDLIKKYRELRIRDSSYYLKAVKASLVTLGYDENWVCTTFANALDARYPIKRSNKSKGE